MSPHRLLPNQRVAATQAMICLEQAGDEMGLAANCTAPTPEFCVPSFYCRAMHVARLKSFRGPGLGGGAGSAGLLCSSVSVQVSLFSVPSQEGRMISCTTPASRNLSTASVALWIDEAPFPVLQPFIYRPDPIIHSISPNCSFE